MSTGHDLTGVLRPVREGNAFEETVERLLTVIKLGLIAPGDRFPAERELAAQLGISRLTLREAIRELAQAGYVESRRGRFGGTFITYSRPAPSVGELRRLALEYGDKLTDALTFRFAVETGAAEVLAQQLAATADERPASQAAPLRQPRRTRRPGRSRSLIPARPSARFCWPGLTTSTSRYPRTTGGSTPCSTCRSPSSPAPACSRRPAPTPGCG